MEYEVRVVKIGRIGRLAPVRPAAKQHGREGEGKA